MDEGWTVCIDSRKEKRRQRRIEQERYAHLISAQKAQQLQRKLNIDNLEKVLLSQEARDLQLSGWIYTRVLRPEATYIKEEGWEYTTLDNFNKWHDRLLFRRCADASARQANSRSSSGTCSAMELS